MAKGKAVKKPVKSESESGEEGNETDSILAELVETFTEKNGRAPTEKEVEKWMTQISELNAEHAAKEEEGEDNNERQEDDDGEVEDGEDNANSQEDDDEDDDEGEDALVTEPKIVKGPINMKKLSNFKDKLEKTGVVYLSRVPPYMKAQKIRHLLSKYGEVNRIYLTPEDPAIRKKRKAMGGNKKQSFVDGWIEFADKNVAKGLCACMHGVCVHACVCKRHLRRDLVRMCMHECLRANAPV